MHIYEYLFSAIIIVTMIVASTFMVQTLSAPHVKISEKEELKITAEKIVNQILFDSGAPTDWGSNLAVPIQSMQSFGLAKYNETTRGAYVLDSDKILRLAYETDADPAVRQKITGLLNLGNDYGIALEFTTPLIVNATHNLGANSYTLTVTSQLGGLPIFNANVTAVLYYVDNGEIAGQQRTSSTNMTGNCVLHFPGFPSQAVLVLAVDYFNIHAVKVVSENPTEMFGNQIHSSNPPSENVCQAIVTQQKSSSSIKSIRSTLTPLQSGWYQVSNVEPSMAATLAVTDQGIVSASRDVSDVTFSSISVGFDELVNPLSYSIERTVVINGQAYLMTFYIWRMSY